MTGPTVVPQPGTSAARRSRFLAWVADAAVVAVFIAIGRRSHDEGAGGFFVTALPFLAALQTAWLVAPRERPTRLPFGLIVWGLTVVLGLLLRIATGDSAAVGFMIVTTLALGLGLVGWRLVVLAVVALRGRRSRV